MSTDELTTWLEAQISELTVVLLVSKGDEAGLLEGEHALLVLQREDEEALTHWGCSLSGGVP